MYKILIKFGIPMKLIKLVKMCLNKTCTTAQLGRHFSDMFHIENGLKQGDALLPLIFNFALKYVIRKVQVYQDGLKLNGTHQLLVYAADVLYWAEAYIL